MTHKQIRDLPIDHDHVPNYRGFYLGKCMNPLYGSSVAPSARVDFNETTKLNSHIKNYYVWWCVRQVSTKIRTACTQQNAIRFRALIVFQFARPLQQLKPPYAANDCSGSSLNHQNKTKPIDSIVPDKLSSPFPCFVSSITTIQGNSAINKPTHYWRAILANKKIVR